MVEIIMNEREWVEEKLNAHSVGSNPNKTIARVAKYYAHEGKSKDQIHRLIEEFLLRCDPFVNLHYWQDTIAYCIKVADKHDMIRVDSIKIYSSELSDILATEGKMQQKLLFTLLCLAKYYNAVNPNNKNWVGLSPKDMFDLANVSVSNKRKNAIINALWEAGAVGYSHIIDNLNLNVKIVSDRPDEQCVVEITDFRSLGNQYLCLIGEPYIPCENCGVMIRKTSRNQKYCASCAAEINRANAAAHRKNAA